MSQTLTSEVSEAQGTDKDIIYAELYIPFDFEGVEIEGSLLLELLAYDITTDWTEEGAAWDEPWTEPGGDIDTLSSYTYSIIINDDDVHMDITRFVQAVLDEELDNCGLMLVPLKYDLPVFHFYEGINISVGVCFI